MLSRALDVLLETEGLASGISEIDASIYLSQLDADLAAAGFQPSSSVEHAAEAVRLALDTESIAHSRHASLIGWTPATQVGQVLAHIFHPSVPTVVSTLITRLDAELGDLDFVPDLSSITAASILRFAIGREGKIDYAANGVQMPMRPSKATISTREPSRVRRAVGFGILAAICMILLFLAGLILQVLASAARELPFILVATGIALVIVTLVAYLFLSFRRS